MKDERSLTKAAITANPFPATAQPDQPTKGQPSHQTPDPQPQLPTADLLNAFLSKVAKRHADFAIRLPVGRTISKTMGLNQF